MVFNRLSMCIKIIFYFNKKKMYDLTLNRRKKLSILCYKILFNIYNTRVVICLFETSRETIIIK